LPVPAGPIPNVRSCRDGAAARRYQDDVLEEIAEARRRIVAHRLEAARIVLAVERRAGLNEVRRLGEESLGELHFVGVAREADCVAPDA